MSITSDFSVTRLGAALGAEVSGVNFTETVDDLVADRLRAALYEHQVLIFKGQNLTREQQLKVAGIFGRPAPSEPTGYLGTTDPVQTFVRDKRREQTADQWHTDTPFMEAPPIAGILMPLEIPKLGGDTVWASLYTIFDTLSKPMKRLCEGLEGVHSMRIIRDLIAHRGDLSPEQLIELDAAFPPRTHPLVRNHWVTGKPLLYDGGEWMDMIAGLNPREGAMLRGFLKTLVDRPEHQFRWKWTLGDIAVWDNLSTNHIGLSDHYLVDPNRTMRSIFAYQANHSMPR